MSSIFEVLDRIKPVLPSTASTGHPQLRQQAHSLVIDATNGGDSRTVITVPVEESALDPESFVTRIRGRLVGAEEANRNNQFWSTGDLVFGVGSVAGGPLNWLHDEKRIVGAITDARLVGGPGRDGAKAATVSAEDRRKMAKSGQAMPDGSFPIPDEEHLRSAIKLARTPAQRRHVIKRAKALGKSALIPDSWREAAGEDVRDLAAQQPHIEAESVLWSFIYPQETHVVRDAAAAGSLFYSMECVSKTVECFGPTGCGKVMAYADSVQRNEAACPHVRDRSSIRRLINPVFLGAAVIVPPVRPGWANAHADVIRRAAASEHVQEFTGGDVELGAQILSFCNQTY